MIRGGSSLIIRGLATCILLAAPSYYTCRVMPNNTASAKPRELTLIAYTSCIVAVIVNESHVKEINPVL